MELEEFVERCQKEIRIGLDNKLLKDYAKQLRIPTTVSDSLKDVYNLIGENITEDNFKRYQQTIKNLLTLGMSINFLERNYKS